MDSDAVKSHVTKMLIGALGYFAGRWHLSGDQVYAIASDGGMVAAFLYGVWAHWGMKKVPDATVAVLPPGGVAPPVGATVTGKVVASLFVLFLLGEGWNVQAADLAVKQPIVVKAAPLTAYSPTSGFYFGLGVGGAGSKNNFDLNIPGTVSAGLHPIGAIPFVKAGYQLWTGAGLIAIEADAGYLFVKSGTPCNFESANCEMKASWHLDQDVIFGLAWPALTGAASKSKLAQNLTPPSQWPIPVNLPQFSSAMLVPYVGGGISEIREQACITSPNGGCSEQWLIGWNAIAGMKLLVAANWDFDLRYQYTGINKNFIPASATPIFNQSEFSANNIQAIKLSLDYHL